MALAYAVSDLSLKDVAAWAHGLGIAEITGPGLFYRLRESECLLSRVADVPECPSQLIQTAKHIR